MKTYFGSAGKYGRQAHERNRTLGGIRTAVIAGKSMLLGTSKPEHWHSILRKEFPDVSLRLVENGVMINEKP